VELEAAFIIIGSVVVPWLTWISKQLWDIRQHTSGIVATQFDHERRILELEEVLPRQIPR